MKNQLAEITISYNKKRNSEPTIIKNSASAHNVCRQAYLETNAQMNLREYFYLVFLNRANHVLGYIKLSEGGICSTVTDLRLAFATALKVVSSGVILCHNHPSGNLKPSKSDIELTKKFRHAGEILDIPILDHLILSNNSYFSFADEAML